MSGRKRKKSTEDTVRFTAEMMCGHTIIFSVGPPKYGDIILCRGCDEYRVVDSVRRKITQPA